MLSDDMVSFLSVYDARFADALLPNVLTRELVTLNTLSLSHSPRPKSASYWTHTCTKCRKNGISPTYGPKDVEVLEGPSGIVLRAYLNQHDDA